MIITCHAVTQSGQQCQRRIDAEVDTLCPQHRGMANQGKEVYIIQSVPPMPCTPCTPPPTIRLPSPSVDSKSPMSPFSSPPSLRSPSPSVDSKSPMSPSSPPPSLRLPSVESAEESSIPIDDNVTINRGISTMSLKMKKMERVTLNVQPPMGYEWMRVGTICDNSCFFHAILYLISHQDYVATKEKTKFVQEYRVQLKNELEKRPIRDMLRSKSHNDILNILEEISMKAQEDMVSDKRYVDTTLESIIEDLLTGSVSDYEEIRQLLLEKFEPDDKNGVFQWADYLMGDQPFSLTNRELEDIEKNIIQYQLDNIADEDYWLTTDELGMVADALEINIFTVSPSKEFYRFSSCSAFNPKNKCIIIFNSSANHWEPIVLYDTANHRQQLHFEYNSNLVQSILKQIDC